MRTFLIRACKLGMCDGDFLFIYTFIYNPNVEAWKKDDEDDEIAKKAYRHLIHVRIKIYNSQRSPVYIGLNSCTSPIIIKLVLRNLKYRRWHINTAYFDWLIKIARGGGGKGVDVLMYGLQQGGSPFPIVPSCCHYTLLHAIELLSRLSWSKKSHLLSLDIIDVNSVSYQHSLYELVHI